MDRKWDELNKEFLDFVVPECALCGKPLNSNNKSGYCQKCYQWSPARLKQKNRKPYDVIGYCRVCGKILRESYCKYEYCSEHREMNPVRKCRERVKTYG